MRGSKKMVPLGIWSAGVPVAVPSTAAVLRYLKWARAAGEPLAMLWQVVQAMPLADTMALWVPMLWRPKASLYWVMVPAVVATAWQAVHWVAELMVPFCQPGVVWPPWHVTLEQVSEGPVKGGLPPVMAPEGVSIDPVDTAGV